MAISTLPEFPIVRSWGEAISKGLVPGATPFSKTGYNPDVDSAAVEDIWYGGGLINFPASAMQMEIISTNANDASGGTGVGNVTIGYLNATGVANTVDVAMNGTTEVLTSVSDIFRVQNFRAKTVGALGVAAGNISLRHTSNTPVYSMIAIGMTRARNSAWTVPAGKTLYITSITASATCGTSGRPAIVTLMATYDDKSALVLPAGFFMPHFEIGLQDQALLRQLYEPVKFPANTDLKFKASVLGNDVMIHTALRGWYE